MSLHTLQREIVAAIFARASPRDARIAVYRNNVFANLREALRDVYPAILRWVGEEYFDAMATAFIRATPSRTGDLHDFGEGFDAFIANFAPSLPWLPDLARLEWAWHRVFHAADPPALDLTGLARARAETIRFRLNPALRLVRSDYPLSAIWAFDGNSALDLDAGGEALAVVRNDDFTVSIERLTDAEFAVLEAFEGGAAPGAHSDLDLAQFMQRAIARRFLVGAVTEN